MTLRGLLEGLIGKELLAIQEFQSAVIRLAVWAFMATFLGLAGLSGYYQLPWDLYFGLFAVHLCWYAAILLSVLRHPQPLTWRRYLSVFADLSGTSLVIYLGGDPLSPFYLFYIWSFVSQGTRYGKRYLLAASVGSVLAYSLVLTVLGGWQRYGYEATFLLLLLMVLPLYQFSLLRQLHNARMEAEEASRARGNFLATMTHELRTPLSGVIGMSRLLNTTELTAEQREYVDSICASANVLQALIGDILDLSKIDAQRIGLKTGVFDLRAILVEVCHALSNQALDKGLELVVRVAGDVPERAYGDDLRFRQILFNLVGNAVKFTAQGHVCVRVQLAAPDADLDARHLKLSVLDTGPGISPEKRQHVFDGFWQADSSPTRVHGGTGLGTTIARDLARLMGGTIGFEDNPGGGSVFWVKLPLVSAQHAGHRPPQPPPALAGLQALMIEATPAAQEALREACQQAQMPCTVLRSQDELRERCAQAGAPLAVDLLVVADSPQGLDLEGIAATARRILQRPQLPVVFLHYSRRPLVALESHVASLVKPFAAPALWQAVSRAQGIAEPAPVPAGVGAAAAAVSAPVALQVLVAEDDNINGKLISSLLTKAGHQVTWVRDGEAALEAAGSTAFDLALVDLRMPRLDGIGFTRRQRAREGAQRLPIIALTANAAEDARVACFEAGMDEFLTKPVDPPALDAVLTRYGYGAQASAAG